MSGSTFGVIGLGTMGRNLALNIEEHGFPVAVWNLETGVDRRVPRAIIRRRSSPARRRCEELVAALERPRRIMMMIPAGAPVDQMIEQAGAAARAGRHPDRRRQLVVRGHAPPRSGAARAGAPLRRLGVSGGEEGARFGPSMMPGGSDGGVGADQGRARGDRREDRRRPVRHARRARRRRPLRQDGAQRHRVRRHAAHRRGLRRAAPRPRPDARRRSADVFDEWNRGPLESFLVELTAQVCRVIDPETGAAAGRRDPGQGRAEGHRQVDGAGRARSRGRDSDHRRGDRRARALEPQGRARRRRAGSLPATDTAAPFAGADRAAWIDDAARRALRGARLQLRPGHGAHRRRRRRSTTGTINLARDGAHLEGRLHHPRAPARSGPPGLHGAIRRWSTCCSIRRSRASCRARRAGLAARRRRRGRGRASRCRRSARASPTSTAIAPRGCRRT